MVPLDRRLLEDSLQELHEDYQGQMVATLSWADGNSVVDASEAGRDFLDQIIDRFWTMVERSTY
jgi:hypothetical protein